MPLLLVMVWNLPMVSANVSQSPQKCHFGVSAIDYIEHCIDCRGIFPFHEKAQAVHNVPQQVLTSPIYH